MRFDLVVPEEILDALRFPDAAGRGRPLKRARSGHAPGLAVDRQALRGVRRLEQDSAGLLAGLLPEMQQGGGGIREP